MLRILVTILILFVSQNTYAETIKLRDGRIIKSKIIRRTDQYIRIEPIYGFAEREFLIQNISSITSDKGVEVFASQAVFQEELQRSVIISSFDQAPEEVKVKAREMATALVQEALRNIKVPDIESSSPEVRQVAQKKANQILEDAMNDSGVTDTVKKAAREMATALIAETVKSSAVPSLEKAPKTVKEIAKEKASELIAEAMTSSSVESLNGASNVVKEAAKENANRLIEEAMKEADVSKVAQEYKSSYDSKQGAELLLQEAVTRRVNETSMKTAVANIANVSGQPVAEDEIVFLPEQKDPVEQINDEQVSEDVGEDFFEADDEMTLDDFLESPDQIDFEDNESQPSNGGDVQSQNSTVQQVQEPIELEEVDAEQIMQKYGVIDDFVDENEDVANGDKQQAHKDLSIDNVDVKVIPEDNGVSVEVEEKPSGFKLGWIHYLILLLMAGLGYFAVKSRFKGVKGGASGSTADVSVLSSMTYQNLDDDIKQRMTSSDVTTILRLAADYQLEKERNAKKGELVMIETQELIDYIEIKAKQAGGFFTSEDIQKVLEVSERAQESL